MSDRNRAMNAVQDIPQKYITWGIQIRHGLRVFRKIRILNLAPSYITNEDDAAPLIHSRAAGGL